MSNRRNIGSRRLVIAALAALSLLAVIPAAASAKIHPPVDQAWFKASLSGSQVTTWEYSNPKVEGDPCSASSYGNGSQSIHFKAPKNFYVLFLKPSPKQPDLLGTKGRPGITTRPGLLYAKAKAEREGDYTVNYGEIDEQNCDAASGGGGGAPPAKDCGVRNGKFRMDLFFHTEPFNDIELPPVGNRPVTDKNRLKLHGDMYQWFGKNGDLGFGLGGTYDNCPFLLRDALAEDQGHIFTVADKLSERQLFNKRRRKFTVSGSEIVKRGGHGASGKTILAWNLRLTRVKKGPGLGDF